MAQEHQEPGSDIREDSEADPGLAPPHPQEAHAQEDSKRLKRMQEAINRDRAMSKK